ncbi:DUF4365 domain-containing protein [Vibrio crassostreae]|nr:DUF4365 domain-containing protein [Vibrio crassostreae]CAK2876015.1 DUF4365 domain-containing protein [Vibrio crassostreae]CAK3483467.1 DUF4365 domain-containing protein [Vibrio crassostreae]
MPSYFESEEVGDIGVDLVSLQVKRSLSWIFREQPKNDLGIDGHIEIVNDQREGTGRLLAAQIKAGNSFFKHETEIGFTFYGKNKHLQYWLLHSLPVILILCDVESDTCYWVEISRTSVEHTDKGWKVVVPKHQVLDIESKQQLIDIAGMPQHTDIVELSLFRFLNEKYHKYSKTGRLDICPLMHEPRDFMYFTCLAEFEKSSEVVFIAHHYDIYEDFSTNYVEKYLLWRDINKSYGDKGIATKLLIFHISDTKEKLIISEEINKLVERSDNVEICGLLYSHSSLADPKDGKFYSLTELNETGEEIYFYE